MACAKGMENKKRTAKKQKTFLNGVDIASSFSKFTTDRIAEPDHASKREALRAIFIHADLTVSMFLQYNLAHLASDDLLFKK